MPTVSRNAVSALQASVVESAGNASMIGRPPRSLSSDQYALWPTRRPAPGYPPPSGGISRLTLLISRRHRPTTRVAQARRGRRRRRVDGNLLAQFSFHVKQGDGQRVGMCQRSADVSNSRKSRSSDKGSASVQIFARRHVHQPAEGIHSYQRVIPASPLAGSHGLACANAEHPAPFTATDGVISELPPDLAG